MPVLGVMLVTACAHIDSQQAAEFNETVSSAGTNFATAINNVQEVQVDSLLDTVAGQPTSPEPDPNDLKPYLTDAIKSHLLSRFNLLVQYAADLSKLSGSQTSFATSVSGLNGALSKDLTDTNDLTSSLGKGGAILSAKQAKSMQADMGTFSGIVASLGQFIINEYAQTKAYKVAANYDGAVATYCRDLQLIIATDPDHPNERGLCAASYWAYHDREVTLWKLLRFTHPDLPEHVVQRRAWLAEYNSLSSNEAKDHAMLISLRAALGKIAQAHHALVTRQDSSFFTEIRDAYATLNGFVTDYKTGSTVKSGTSSTTKPTGSSSATATAASTSTPVTSN